MGPGRGRVGKRKEEERGKRQDGCRLVHSFEGWKDSE
jgi:hypothetical protein